MPYAEEQFSSGDGNESFLAQIAVFPDVDAILQAVGDVEAVVNTPGCEESRFDLGDFDYVTKTSLASAGGLSQLNARYTQTFIEGGENDGRRVGLGYLLPVIVGRCALSITISDFRIVQLEPSEFSVGEHLDPFVQRVSDSPICETS